VFLVHVGKRSGIRKNGGLKAAEPPILGLIRVNLRPLMAQKSDLPGE
jgi:hypothetical protein